MTRQMKFIGSAAAGICGLLICSLSPQMARAAAQDSVQAQASDATLQSIVVIGTRVAEPSADLPMSIDRIERDQIAQGQMQVNLSESLDQIPGVSAQNRQNYAQDLQLSVRGFGARSSFGVRGVRLYSDGIPATMPDGQGQFSHFDLGSAGHIEVLRGPFSALYGNSSGGVIALFTQEAPPGGEVTGTAQYGSFGTQRYALKGMLGQPGGVNLVIDASHFSTGGYRDHSAAERNNFNAVARWQLDAQSRLTLVGNAVETPFVQDPLGLTSAQVAADPRQAGVGALDYNTRKSLGQEQLGAIYERTLSSADQLSAMIYGGHRKTVQFQSIPKASESSPTHPGGVINLGRGYGGLDVHVTDKRTVAGTPLQTTIGVSYDRLNEARQGNLNFIGDQLGVLGQLRRDQSNRVYDLDEYLQMQWDPTARWRAVAGVRNSVVDVTSHDHTITTGPAVSGVRYSAVNPVVGLTYKATEHLHVYGAYGKGFETPTMSDLSYRSTNFSLPGLNFALQPARSDNYEIGIKANAAHLAATLAAFYTKTNNELAVLANAGGRSVYQNIAQTTRKGAELALDNRWSEHFSGRLAYTYIQAITAQDYTTCTGFPCSPVVVAAGNRLPAVPAGDLYAGVTWRPRPLGVSVTLEAQDRTQIYADDLNTAAADGYWLANLHADFAQDSPRWRVTESLRIDNLANHRYVGTVIVNASNARYFEPDPGRTAYLMFSVTHR